jgi:hypothetical protein
MKKIESKKSRDTVPLIYKKLAALTRQKCKLHIKSASFGMLKESFNMQMLAPIWKGAGQAYYI